MQIQPLGLEILMEAQRMALGLFPWEDEHQLALAAAVKPAEYTAFCVERRLQSVRCWTAHESGGSLRGIASLYGYAAQPDEVWLAWFGLMPEARGRGAGGRLLDLLINRSRSEGRQTMRLWTTDEPEYAAATQLYRKRGFIEENCPPVPGEDWRTMVFSLGLTDRRPIPWSCLPDRAELCGRRVDAAASLAA